MGNGTTLDARRARTDQEDAGLAGGFALVLVWAKEQPARVGEVLLFPEAEGDRRYVFGRGDDGDAERIHLARQRPGSLVGTGPLEDDYVSRKQLVCGWHTDGVRVENVGKLSMHVGDAKLTRAVVRPGETLEIDRQLLFLSVERPPVLAACRDVPSETFPSFAEADASGFVGESPAAWELRDRTAFIAARDGHVLLLGESGTGKELVAQAIHRLSTRAGKKLVARNAATFPAGLIDAELFGHVANYPNPGMAERPGVIGEADGGTLFLDELGELPEALQTHLLRVLDAGEYQRLGDARRRRADLRVIGATNRGVDELKADLAARLRLRMHLPPLNERLEDVPLLARHELRKVAAKDAGIRARFFEGDEPRLAVGLARALVTHRYTTHVRELSALVWSSLTTSRGKVAELTSEVRAMMGPRADEARPAVSPATISEQMLREALARHGGVKDRVWRELGLQNRFVLRRLLKKYDIRDEGD